MSELEKFFTQLGEDLNAIELELSDNLPRKIGDGKQYVHGIIVNGGSEDAVLKLFFRNNSQITTTLGAGQALELQSIPLAQMQNVQAGQNPNITAYLTTSGTMLGAPKISVVGAPSVQDVSFNGVAQPVNVNNVSFQLVSNAYLYFNEGTITSSGVIQSYELNNYYGNGPNTAITRSTIVINIGAISGTSPTISFQLYTVVGSNVSGTSSYISSPPSNLIANGIYYWAPLPNATTGSITTTGVYTLSTTTPLPGIMLYATVGGTSPSITINISAMVSMI